MVELVPGREDGEEEPSWCSSKFARSPAFRFFKEGRKGVARSGFPKARPAAAIPTVLEATSYRNQEVSFDMAQGSIYKKLEVVVVWQKNVLSKGNALGGPLI